MNVLLLYSSKTGFTRRYAQWIGEELGLRPTEWKDCTAGQLAEADLIVYGGSVNGGIITGQTKVERMARKAGNRPVIWFAVGLRPPTLRTMELLRKNNFGRDSEAPLFYFPGGLDKEKLPPGDRTMLRVYRAMLRRRRDLDPEDEGMIDRLSIPGDHTDRTAIEPLVDLIRTAQNSGKT